MWRITYLDNGCYSIRPLNIMTSGLYAYSSGYNVGINNIGTSNQYSAINGNGKWLIEYTSSGYVFKLSAASYYAMQISQLSTANSVSVNVATYQSGQTRFCWNLTQVTSPPSGMLLYNTSTGYQVSNPTKYVANGTTATPASLGLKAVPYGDIDTYNVVWTSSDISVATINTSTGTITPKTEGTATISAKTIINGVNYQVNYNLEIIPIANGTYFIKNKQYGNYVQVDNNASPNFSTNNSPIEAWDFKGEDYQKWEITYVGNGYYKIISAKSGLAITVQSAYLNTTDKNLVQTAYTGAANQQWKISKTTSGNYKIAPKSAESTTNDWCMCSGSASLTEINGFTNGKSVQQRYYGNDSNYEDEWELEPYSAVFYGITNSGHDHVSVLTTIQRNLLSNNWSSVVVREGAISSSQCKSDLLSTNIFTSRGHGQKVLYSGSTIGAATGIQLNDESGDDAVFFYSHSLSNMTSGSDSMKSNEDYSNIDIALFIGCETAYGEEGQRNLPSAIVSYGATVAVGFSENIGCTAANTWTTNFYTMMLSGATVEKAVEYACDQASENSGLKSKVICGDGTVTFP